MPRRPTNPRVLFVYGTLERSGPGHGEMDSVGGLFVCRTATKPFYRVVELSPGELGMTLGRDAVAGELYVVPDAGFRALDRYEYTIYQREVVTMRSGLLAWAYMLVEPPQQ